MIRHSDIKRALAPTLAKALLGLAIVCFAFVFFHETSFSFQPKLKPSQISRLVGATLASPALLPGPIEVFTQSPAPVAPAPVLHAVTPANLKRIARVHVKSHVAKLPSHAAAHSRGPKAPHKKVAVASKPSDDKREEAEKKDDSAVAETFLENAPEESGLAIDFKSPLDQEADAALAEQSASPDFDPDSRVSAAQADPMLTLDKEMPLEQRFAVVDGTLQRNDFAEIKEKLRTIKTDMPTLIAVGEPPASQRAQAVAAAEPTLKNEPVLVRPAPAASVAAVTAPKAVAAKAKAAKTTVAAAAAPKPIVAAASTPSVVAPSATKVQGLSKVEATIPEPKEASVTPELVRPTRHAIFSDNRGDGPSSDSDDATLATQAPVATTVPTLATAAVAPVTGVTIAPVPSTHPHIRVFVPQPAMATQQSVAAPKVNTQLQSSDEDADVETDGGTMYGTLNVDRDMEDWLAAAKGHIELYLHPVKSRNPQDFIFVDYQYPDTDFEIDVHELKGHYRLVAGVFVPKATTAIAQIAYPHVITAADYKHRIRFYIRKSAFDQAQKHWMTSASELVFSATIFEGAAGNYRSPKPIKGAKVRLIGYPELGTFVADSDGNVRIPSVPGRSELMLDVEADGYYPSYPVIPTFSSNVYSPLYLIAKDKVDAITRYFTRNPQSNRRGIIMGRVFDPVSRAPLQNEQLALSFRRGRALYFDALPDPMLPATTETGLFGFFNVSPSFRSLMRAENKPAYLLNVLPGSAEYVELGRGGKKSLIGKLIDPFSDHMPVGKVRLVGSPNTEVYTDQDGNFTINDIDFPPSVLTIEVEAEGFPLTWHSIPWNTREPETSRSLFMMEKDLITESAMRVARITMRREKGSVVGGAEASFFGKGNRCVMVSLEDPTGAVVPNTSGPFPLVGDPLPGDTALCLTKQKPGFAYFNLQPGEYILKWETQSGRTFRSRVVHVGIDRVSVVVN